MADPGNTLILRTRDGLITYREWKGTAWGPELTVARVVFVRERPECAATLAFFDAAARRTS